MSAAQLLPVVNRLHFTLNSLLFPHQSERLHPAGERFRRVRSFPQQGSGSPEGCRFHRPTVRAAPQTHAGDHH